MRVAVIADVHGNLEALEAVLADIRDTGVDAVYCLGDVIGYGADPAACLDLVCEHCEILLQGNHEDALLQPAHIAAMNPVAAVAERWTQTRLTGAQRERIAQWPLVKVGADARLVHGSPDEPLRFHYLQHRWNLENAFRAFSETICFFGHTHVPAAAAEIVPGVVQSISLPSYSTDRVGLRHLALEPGNRYVVNGGSVGQPRDNDPRAKWLLVREKPPELEFRALSYDIAVSQKKILSAGLPEFLASRLEYGQ